MNQPALTFLPCPKIPALDLPLTGIHLIEASAGTGKTWTLSALMVRLIVEQKYFTRQIIATTFTRAAAAELRARIRKRIEEIRSLFDASHHDQHATLQAMQDKQDWLAVHLLQTLDLTQQGEAKNRLQLALDSFDDLFVGTLDSFCQKLLTEFAFDSGQHEVLQITTEEQELCYQALHDALREWRSQQQPQIIELLVMTGQLRDVEAYIGSVGTVLNFLSAKVQPVNQPQLDWDALAQLQQQLQQTDMAVLDAYLSPEGEYFSFLTKNRAFTNQHQIYQAFVAGLQQNLLDTLVQSAKDSAGLKWLAGFSKIDGNFNKAGAAVKEQFMQLPATQQLVQVLEQYDGLQSYLEQLQQYLRFHLAQTVRQRLPQLLSERGETTFSQQMRVLAQVLQSEQGPELAQHILHRYPAALVDEFQDTNADQDSVIAAIWRQSAAVESNTVCSPSSCVQAYPRTLVMVGDPKQAIYGFRGGDMLTYQKARQHVAKLGQQHVLGHNQRSIAPLVDAVDALFQLNRDFGEQVEYQPVMASGRNHDLLRQDGIDNFKPLRLLDIQDGVSEDQQTAWQIISLMQASQAGQLQIQREGELRPLEPNDIAVLGRSNRDLDAVEALLQKANIPVWRNTQRSVFQSALAEDLIAVMQLLLHPTHEGRLRRVMGSTLVGWQLSQLNQLDTQPDELAMLQSQFFELGECWHKAGFLSAWQQFLQQFAVWQQLSRQADGERLVVNLRHLTELLFQQSEQLSGQHRLLSWLMRQVASPKSPEWALERRLSGEQGIQLMTIHKSKGLEFAVVFVVGVNNLNGGRNAPEVVFFEQTVAGEGQQRMLGFNTSDATQLSAHEAREQAEVRRLIYVALTRASLRLYVPVKIDKQTKEKSTVLSALRHWLPDDRAQWTHPQWLIESTLQEAPAFHYVLASRAAVDIQPKALPVVRVQAWGVTSFSQMSRHQPSAPVLTEEHAEEVIQPEQWAHEDEVTEPEQLEIVPEANPALCFSFPRGANAGDCLHQILEHIHFSHQHFWPKHFERQLQAFGIQQQVQQAGGEPISLDALRQWFEQIVNAALPHGASLAQLDMRASSHVREFEFHLSLADRLVPVTAIERLMQQHAVPVPALNQLAWSRYLHGFIDLLYEHDGRFYIADYKSNYLGDQVEDYAPAQLKDSMSQAGYWLQAALYQVALHRYLQVRLPDYQPEQHLGGAVYLYLRGLQAQSDAHGVLYWPADIDLIMQLDQLLGYAQVACE